MKKFFIVCLLMMFCMASYSEETYNTLTCQLTMIESEPRCFVYNTRGSNEYVTFTRYANLFGFERVELVQSFTVGNDIFMTLFVSGVYEKPYVEPKPKQKSNRR